VIKLPIVPSLGFTASIPVLSSIDPAAVALFLVSALLLFRFKLGLVPVLCFCAIAGLVLRLSGLV
jgi:membrane-bound metal-dependent hydrolase YbcI (DUF457 family)